MSLEELEQSFVNALGIGRRGNWLLGDVINKAITTYGRKVMGGFAVLGRCSRRHIQQLAKVSGSFDETARDQYPDMPWSIFRLAAQTDNPASWLEQAASNEWSEAELRRAIRGEKPLTAKVERILRQSERMFAAGGDDADALEDGLRELLRGRGE